MRGQVYVTDSSALIGVTEEYSESDQERIFECLEPLVDEGKVSFPAVVRQEVGSVEQLDSAARWVQRTSRSVQYSAQPDDRLIAAAMQCSKRRVATFAEADADTVIIAHALDLKETGHDVCVVTLDVKRRRNIPSMNYSCMACGISTVTSLQNFLNLVGCLPA